MLFVLLFQQKILFKSMHLEGELTWFKFKSRTNMDLSSTKKIPNKNICFRTNNNSYLNAFYYDLSFKLEITSWLSSQCNFMETFFLLSRRIRIRTKMS